MIILTLEIEKTMAQSQERKNSFSSVVFDDFYNQDQINSLKKRYLYNISIEI